jgi:hypothetical protein
VVGLCRKFALYNSTYFLKLSSACINNKNLWHRSINQVETQLYVQRLLIALKLIQPKSSLGVDLSREGEFCDEVVERKTRITDDKEELRRANEAIHNTVWTYYSV